MSLMKTIYSKLKPRNYQMINEAMILDELRKVNVPDNNKNIIELNLVHDFRFNEGKVSFSIQVEQESQFNYLKKQCYHLISQLPSVSSLSMTQKVVKNTKHSSSDSDKQRAFSKIDHIIAIASGKGGVGKSTVAFNLARTLAKKGAKVGVLDADIYGPSIPTLTKVEKPKYLEDGKIIPPIKDGLKIISIPMFTENDKAQIIRGPMAANFVKQFLTNVAWGELDYLIIDFPPGTGDIQLTLAQVTTITAALVVTTPQELSLKDVHKSIEMLNTLKIPILGIIENMSYFICDDCDKKHYIFSKNGGTKLAKLTGFPFISEIPLEADHDPCNHDEEKQSSLDSVYDKIAVDSIRELSILKSKNNGALESFNLKWNH